MTVRWNGNWPDEKLIEWAHKTRDNIVAARLERTMSTRFILRAYNWIQHGKTLKYVSERFFDGWREDEIRKAGGR